MKLKLSVLAVMLTACTITRGDTYMLNENLEDTPANCSVSAPGDIEKVPGRVKDRKALLLKNGASLSWSFPKANKEGCFIEFWIKSGGWAENASQNATLCSFAIGNDVYKLQKPASQSNITMDRNNERLFSYPVYSWGKQSWVDQHLKKKGADNPLWHYVNIGMYDGQLTLTIDANEGFKENNAPVEGALKSFSIGGDGNTCFSELHIVNAGKMDGIELRNRFRSLYRGLPDLHKNTVTVPFIKKPLKIDGKFSEEKWKEAATIVGFTRTGYTSPGYQHLCEERIKGYIAYDERYLYMAIRTPYQGELRAKKWNAYDKPLYGEESWEIFLHPPFTGVPDFCQLIGNVFGDQCDLKMLNLTWNGKWDWKTSFCKSEWIAEFRADFNGISTPPPGDSAVWTMNLCNTFGAAAWCNTVRYNDSESFGVLRFDKSAPSIRPERFSVTGDSISVPVEIKSNGATLQAIELSLQVYNSKDALPLREDKKLLKIQPGQKEFCEMKVSIAGMADGKAALYIREGKTELYYQSFDFPAAPPKTREPVVEGWGALTPDKKEAAEKKASPSSAQQNIPEAERKAYSKKWTAQQLGETLLESSEWVNNKIGISKNVPAPWTPKKVEGQNINCWGRSYQYQNSLFPVRILTQSENLLAKPPRIVISSGGKRHEFSTAEFSIADASDEAVKVKCVSKSGPFQLELDTTFEYDGMAKIEMSLSCPDDPGVVDACHLEIPLKSEFCKLFHVTASSSGHAPASNSDFMPKSEFILNEFRESVWFGDNYRGLCWFAENMKDWRIRDESAIESVSPDENGIRFLKIKLADKTFKVDRPWRIVFGIQATPVKPLPADFRKRSYRDFLDWRWFWGEGAYYPFQSTYVDKAKEAVLAARKAGKELMPCSSLHFYGEYYAGIGAQGESPNGGLKYRELLLWGSLWQQSKIPLDSPVIPERQTSATKWYGKKNEPGELTGCCAASPWQDFYIWNFDRLVRDTELGAIYLDQPISGCSNSHHGCGYINYKGEWTPSVPIFAMRTMLKRIYTILYEKHHSAMIRWHSSNQIVPPIISFAEVFWDGENYGSGPHKVFEFYSQALSAGRLQSQHFGKHFGIAIDVCPNVEQRYAPTQATERDILGVMMVHDAVCWPTHCMHPLLLDHIQKIKLSYPLDKMQTVYYWDKNKKIQVSPKDVAYILYSKDDLVLLVLFNWSDLPVASQVKLDLGELSDTGTVTDAETGEKLANNRGSITVPLLPRDFRMIEIKK
jgi:hypothetical protein